MVAFADIRYCTKDAWFQVKEAELGNCYIINAKTTKSSYYLTKFVQLLVKFTGLAADVGALQQLPKVIGSASLARELCLTARKMFSDEARESGFVNRVFNDKEE